MKTKARAIPSKPSYRQCFEKDLQKRTPIALRKIGAEFRHIVDGRLITSAIRYSIQRSSDGSQYFIVLCKNTLPQSFRVRTFYKGAYLMSRVFKSNVLIVETDSLVAICVDYPEPLFIPSKSLSF